MNICYYFNWLFNLNLSDLALLATIISPFLTFISFLFLYRNLKYLKYQTNQGLLSTKIQLMKEYISSTKESNAVDYYQEHKLNIAQNIIKIHTEDIMKAQEYIELDRPEIVHDRSRDDGRYINLKILKGSIKSIHLLGNNIKLPSIINFPLFKNQYIQLHGELLKENMFSVDFEVESYFTGTKWKYSFDFELMDGKFISLKNYSKLLK